jgi:aminoglycoside phosphotransferase (APT) family kinase protein
VSAEDPQNGIADGLRRWLGEALEDAAIHITGLRRTSVGFSRENWVFDARWQNGRGAFIARRDPIGSVLDTDRRVEIAVLSALGRSSVPVPRLRWADVDGTRLGRPAIIMDLADGVCEYMVLNGDRPLERRIAIARQLCDRLADLHLTDWRALGLADVLEDPGSQAALRAAEYWEGVLRGAQLEAEPELDLVIDWLKRHAPVSQITTLVHGDFKPGNVLMRGDEVATILDWETAHLGDPLEDIGWVTNPLRAGEQQIKGAWERGDILRHWSRRTGYDADPKAIHWWNVLANLKQSLTVLTGMRAFADRKFDRMMHAPVRIYRLLLDLIEA